MPSGDSMRIHSSERDSTLAAVSCFNVNRTIAPVAGARRTSVFRGTLICSMGVLTKRGRNRSQSVGVVVLWGGGGGGGAALVRGE